MYQLIRSILFLLPAERAHYISMNLLKAVCSIGLLRRWVSSMCKPDRGKPITVFGLSFKNPVGLGAGFDKNARYLRELEALGFGFIEIGTVTPRPQAGNPKPRLFRLPTDQALINRMGFNNDGVEVIKERLKAWRKREEKQRRNGSGSPLLIGGNIGKNKDTTNEDAWQDYEICFRALHAFVDFFVVNVSSPNTPGLRALQEKPALHKILTHLQGLNRQFGQQKPLLLKIAPDLTNTQIDDVIDLAMEIGLDGLVASNTTISREGLQTPLNEVEQLGMGGLSGKPLTRRATEVLQYINTKTGAKLPVIGSGGIFTGADAREKLDTGAILVEVWTGFIYEGPVIVKNICKHLNN